MIYTFLGSVMAGVVSGIITYYFCKWLDGKTGGK
jgi:NhaP-type Na+/H+ or K+/H+ antiporter